MLYELHEKVLACEIDAIKAAIEKGVDLDELDGLGNSPLHWAVMCGYEDVVALLLEAGADANTLSSDGITPKWSAVDFGLTEIEELLTSYGGKIDTGAGFDKTSWSVFKNFLGGLLPENE